MASKDVFACNQIAKIQTHNRLIALHDKLKPAPAEHYAQLHAKREWIDGQKQNSLIEVEVQDQTNGTGANNIITRFRLEPEQIQFFLTRITAGFQEFSWTSDKIYGEPDQYGLCIADKFVIARQPLDNNGKPKRNPWFVQIQNGRAKRIGNSSGGGYIDGKTFHAEKSAFINLTDMDLFTLLKRADAYIQAWENYEAAKLIESGKACLESSMQNRQTQNPNYGSAQPNSYQQTPYYTANEAYGQDPFPPNAGWY